MPFITNDAIVLGLLFVIISTFITAGQSNHPFLKKIFKITPPVLFCYFVPSFCVSLGLISAETSQLYTVVSRYFLPTLLILLTLSTDLKAIFKLGPKSLIMFFTATFSIIIGGPIALFIVSFFSPDILGGAGPDALWRAFSTLAGTWIGASANQAAMKEIFMPSNELFSAVVLADVFIGGMWLAVLFIIARHSVKIDTYFKSDRTSIDGLIQHMKSFKPIASSQPSVKDLFQILAIGFGLTALCHFLAERIAPWIGQNYPFLSHMSLNSVFLWIILLASFFGLALSFTRFARLEEKGASKIGTIMLYLLIATIGMHMDITGIVKYPLIILIAFIWIIIHVLIMFIMAKLIKAPMFFLAIGSQANIGGAASAPIVAAEFCPSLMPVGVLYAVFGYAIGNYGALLCTHLMQLVTP